MSKLFNKFEETCSGENGIKNFVKSLKDSDNLVKAFEFIHKWDGSEAVRKVRNDVKYSIHFRQFERELCDIILQTFDDKNKAKFIIDKLFHLLYKSITGQRLYSVEEMRRIINAIDKVHFDDAAIFDYLYHRKDDVVEINNTLINKMNNINYADAVGRNLLNIFIVSSWASNVEIHNATVNLLINLGVDINHCNKNNTSVLNNVISCRNVDAINILINNNVIVDDKSREKINKSNKDIKVLFG